MARILIGSSNIYRFYEPSKYQNYNPYIMVNCTKMEVFKVKMGELGPEDKEIVISVIENFVCDAVDGVRDETVATGLYTRSVKDFMDTVRETSKRLPESRFALTQPILRPGNAWYTTKHEDLCRDFIEGVNAMKQTNVTKLDALSRSSQKFEYDGIHLTPECGSTFVGTTLETAQAFFDAEMVDLEGMMEIDVMEKVMATVTKTGGPSKIPLMSQVQAKASVDDRLTRLEKEVGRMGSENESRRFFDSLVSARM